jgi:hypothetical protein
VFKFDLENEFSAAHLLVALRPVPGPFVGWHRPPGATRRAPLHQLAPHCHATRRHKGAVPTAAPSRQQRFEPPLPTSRLAVSEHRVAATFQSRMPLLSEAARRHCSNPAPSPPSRAPPPPVRVSAPSSSPRRPSPHPSRRSRSFQHHSLLLCLPVCRSPLSTPVSSAASPFSVLVRPLPCPLPLRRRAAGAAASSRALA